MRTYHYIIGLFGIMLFSQNAMAQRGYIRNQVRQNIENDMKKKHGEENRKKGKEEIEKITYENDKRYNDYTNNSPLTITMGIISYDKKEVAKDEITTIMIMGKVGECYIMNQGAKDEMHMIYNYKDKANYIVNTKDKTAMKMPMVGFNKMTEKSAHNDYKTNTTWEATNETQKINGYNCKKYICTHHNDKKISKSDIWVTKEASFKFNGNYVVGTKLSNYSFNNSAKIPKGMPTEGVMIRTVSYDKSGKKSSQTDIKSIANKADESVFDLSKYKVTDVLSGL